VTILDVRTSGLPAARGPLSEAVTEVLRQPAGTALPAPGDADPLGADLQLALALCYELHYQAFPGVDPRWEWDPELLGFRARLEALFEGALRDRARGGTDIAGEFDELLVEHLPGSGLSHYMVADGTWEQMRELFAHRSIYHLKEADPHAWVIPRLSGVAKAALVAVEFDEFGGGRADRMHSRLYADLLTAAGLDAGYLHYVDHVPAAALATVNMMSMFGLHRRLRGALVGHFAAAEITTGPSAQRMDKALARFDAPAACRFFYTEHVEADAVHEQVLRHDVVGGLVGAEPELAADVVFGIQATDLLEQDFSDHVLGAWNSGGTSLLLPL